MGPGLHYAVWKNASVEVTFLGSGAAFSPDAYNACILVDRTLLMDAGAPLCVHLPRVGLGIDAPRGVLLTHFHADHTFGLAGLLLGRALSAPASGPLTILGPRGTEPYVRQLLDFAWGEEMRELTWERLRLAVHELDDGDASELLDYRVLAFGMTHSQRFHSLGFVLEHDGVRLGYSGDAERSPALERLLNASDHAIVGMTLDRPGPTHLSRPEIVELMADFPQVRFILTHRGVDGPVSGALLASDFLSLRLPLP
jgi:ribonuclease BN (tRNA processing enzyme)